MPMPILSIPPFPDIPDLPGVPALARSLTAQVGAGINGLLGQIGISPIVEVALPVWGVFDDNNDPVAIADSVRTFDFDSESRVSDYPQEDGGFESYNKVQLPYQAVVSLTCGGDTSQRAAFLAALQDAKESTDLYTIVTPEIVYTDANIVGLRYRRTERDGATLLTVDLRIEEIRVTATAAFGDDNTQNPASSDPINLGQIQAQPPSAGQAALYGPASVVQGTVPTPSVFTV